LISFRIGELLIPLASGFTIRRARRRDARGILDLLKALAEFEHLDPPDAAAKKRLIRDIFSRKKLLRVFVAADPNSGRLVGYALYFYTYSSFLARPTLYLEDIFVLEEYRRQGIGLRLFKCCVAEAERNKCGRMEWSALTWNQRAIDFYEKLGARKLEEWRQFRLTGENLMGLLHGNGKETSKN
jgi:GNAT superfamily N-acetyltransferase